MAQSQSPRDITYLKVNVSKMNLDSETKQKRKVGLEI